MFYTILALPSQQDCTCQSQIFYSLSQVSSLFLIDNIAQYIHFVHSNVPLLASHHSLSALLANIINQVFIVYTEMRNITFAFNSILQDASTASLSTLYVHESIQQCLREQIPNILPLQLYDILNSLLPFVLDDKYVIRSFSILSTPDGIYYSFFLLLPSSSSL